MQPIHTKNTQLISERKTLAAPGPNCFIFMQFSGKNNNGQIIGCPPPHLHLGNPGSATGKLISRFELY